MRIAIATLGCKVNQFETAAVSDMVRALGYSIVRFSERADVYIVNTCTVTGKTDFQSRQLVRRANRANPGAAIIVTGCYAQASPDHFSGMSGVRLVTGNAEKEKIPALIAGLFPADTENAVGPRRGPADVLVGNIRDEKEISLLCPTSFKGRTRAFVRIQDGCNAACAYCIVPAVRGRSRSLPPEAVLSQLRMLAEAGHQEAVLTGIHLGTYGADLTPAVTIAELLRELEAGSPIRRIRLSSIEPREISPEFIDLIKNSRVFCPHLHIPLQSGDDSILAAMSRDYDCAYYRYLALRLCKTIPGLALGTDLMAGFPGETDQNFENTVKLVRSLPFAYLHVFPYSDRPRTAASAMTGKVPDKVKSARAALLRDIGREKRELFAGRFVGRELAVLVEGRKDRDTGCLQGFTDNYIPVLVRDAGANDINSIITVTAEQARAGKLTGVRLHGC